MIFSHPLKRCIRFTFSACCWMLTLMKAWSSIWGPFNVIKKKPRFKPVIILCCKKYFVFHPLVTDLSKLLGQQQTSFSMAIWFSEEDSWEGFFIRVPLDYSLHLQQSPIWTYGKLLRDSSPFWNAAAFKEDRQQSGYFLLFHQHDLKVWFILSVSVRSLDTEISRNTCVRYSRFDLHPTRKAPVELTVMLMCLQYCESTVVKWAPCINTALVYAITGILEVFWRGTERLKINDLRRRTRGVEPHIWGRWHTGKRSIQNKTE